MLPGIVISKDLLDNKDISTSLGLIQKDEKRSIIPNGFK